MTTVPEFLDNQFRAKRLEYRCGSRRRLGLGDSRRSRRIGSGRRERRLAEWSSPARLRRPEPCEAPELAWEKGDIHLLREWGETRAAVERSQPFGVSKKM